MKNTRKDPSGTSFHNDTFQATVSELRQILGEPYSESNDGQDKVNFDWVMETEDGQVFTVYDWKEYRPLSEDEIIEWHIGGHSSLVTMKASREINAALSEI